MRIRLRTAVVAVLCSLAPCVLSAQQTPDEAAASQKKPNKNHARTLSRKDGRSVVAVALSSKARHDSANDCSHLVHAVYRRAGFPYVYASSDDLYDGVEGFRRVSKPQAGDLIVWRGHVGIVVQPSRHVFFSFLTAGPGTDDYHSSYWIGRGKARFYRYIKNDPCSGCTSTLALRQDR